MKEKWSPRSSSSLATERGLQEELQRCQDLRRNQAVALADLEKEQRRAVGLVKSGVGFGGEVLSEALRKIEDARRKLAVFTDLVSQAEAALDEFRRVTVEEAPERLRQQNELANEVEATLELDEVIERARQGMCALLEARATRKARMEALADSIELRCNLGGGVSDSLLATLSEPILPASKAWAADLLGRDEGLKPYIVVDKQLALPETLARSAPLFFGQTVHLSDEEARELLREDRAKPESERRYPWEIIPPSIMTPEAFAQAEAEAPDKRLVFVLLQQRHEARQRMAAEAYRRTQQQGQSKSRGDAMYDALHAAGAIG